MLVVRRISKYGNLADVGKVNKIIPGQVAVGLNGDISVVMNDGRDIAHAP